VPSIYLHASNRQETRDFMPKKASGIWCYQQPTVFIVKTTAYFCSNNSGFCKPSERTK